MSDKINQIEEIEETPKPNFVVRFATNARDFFKTKTGKVVLFSGITAGAGIATYMVGFRGGVDAAIDVLRETTERSECDANNEDVDGIEIAEIEEIEAEDVSEEE